MRMFTHYALQTAAAKPLNDWLDKAGPVSALMQTARELAAQVAQAAARVVPAVPVEPAHPAQQSPLATSVARPLRL